jgi:Tfp pilus assembly protein PilO
MKASDRTILLSVLVLGIAVGFYLMVLSPKRQEASKLGDQIDTLQASVSQQQQVADFGEQARRQFPRYYGRLVVLGKAVPEQADTASMLVQLSSIADHTGVDFRSISLSQAASGTGTSSPPPTAAAASGTTADSSSTSGSAATTSASTATTPASGATSSTTGATSSTTGAASAASAAPVPATESAAATQPIGATVGPAGLPTLPYDLTFTGGFFDVANFIGGVDGLVTPQGASQVAAEGRLLTVDGFALKIVNPGANPKLTADFAVTSYVAPAIQGLTAGASPSGPAPASPTQPATQTASATVAQ